jgi:hypothetical protein
VPIVVHAVVDVIAGAGGTGERIASAAPAS